MSAVARHNNMNTLSTKYAHTYVHMYMKAIFQLCEHYYLIQHHIKATFVSYYHPKLYVHTKASA